MMFKIKNIGLIMVVLFLLTACGTETTGVNTVEEGENCPR